RIVVASFRPCFVLSPLYESSLGFRCLFTDDNRNRAAQRLLPCRMNLCRGRRFRLLLLQQTPSKEKLNSFQEVALAPVGARGLPYHQLSNRLENFLRRWRHKAFHPVGAKSALQFVHFLGSPGRMDTQTDDTRSHFI